MGSSKKTLLEVGRTVSATLDESLPQMDDSAQKHFFVTHAGNMESLRTRKPKPVWLAAAAVVTIAITGAVLFATFDSNSMSYRVVGESEHTGHNWIQASPSAATSIDFEDGSNVLLQSNAAARIIESRKENVVIDLTRGEVDVDIRSAGTTLWEFRAGPHSLTVLGTAFRIYWDADVSIFDVTVSRGEVLVRLVGKTTRELKLAAGDHLRSNGNSHWISVDSPASVEAVHSESPPQDVSRTPETSAPKQVDEAPLHGSKRQSASSPRKSTPKESSDDLWQHANAARRTGRGSDARGALEKFRDRFPESPRSRRAAFILGRIALEEDHDPKTAENWFETYLREAPNGPFAENALGRLMTIYKTTRNIEKQSECAGQYLSKYPEGQYIKLAESLMAE